MCVNKYSLIQTLILFLWEVKEKCTLYIFSLYPNELPILITGVPVIVFFLKFFPSNFTLIPKSYG